MIQFQSITLQNFQSYGDVPTTFQLDKSPTTLICGTNGSGKSSILNALVFCLFGKTLKGVKKDSLINTVNQKGCSTECSFKKGNDSYVVFRAMKPGMFRIELNGVLMEEEAGLKDQQKILDDILGFDYSSFVKTCVLSTENYIPFLQLSTGDRRNFIESLLGISVFSGMNKHLKVLISLNKDSIQSLKSELDLKKAVYTEKKNRFDDESTANTAKKDQITSRLLELKSSYDALQAELDELSSILIGKTEYLATMAKDSIESSIDSRKEKLHEIKTSLKHAKKKISIYASGKCAECDSVFTSNKDSLIYSQEKDMSFFEQDQLTVSMELDKIYVRLDEIKGIEGDIRSLETMIDRIKSNMTSTKSMIMEKKKEYDALSTVVPVGKDDIATLVVEIRGIAARYESEVAKRDMYKIAADLLKDDGIKANIIRQYIPIINTIVNQNLEILNSNHRIKLDEQFNDTLNSRFDNEMRYDNLSMGEKQRIDLSLLMAIRRVGAMKNSVNCNVLFLDEVADASMDSSGTDDLMVLLDDISKDTHVFIVSHKSNLTDKVRSVINLGKVAGFTKIL